MSATLEILGPIIVPPHKRWTRDECVVLEQTGLIDSDRYELIEGELIQKMGKNHPHMLTVLLLGAWLRSIFGETFVVQEPSIDLWPEDSPTSEPEPDMVVLRRSFREFSTRAIPSDLRLVVEVSSSTLTFDLTTKARLYARSRIVEYWVIDVAGRRVIVHRDPDQGEYKTVTAYAEQESVATSAVPEREIRVGDLF